MTEGLKIYTQEGELRYQAIIGIGSIAKFTLMQEDYIMLKFSSAELIEFHLGDYIDLNPTDYATSKECDRLHPILCQHLNRYYELSTNYTPNWSVTNGVYEYELKFEAEYFKWKNKLMMVVSVDTTVVPNLYFRAETSVSYTETLERHAEAVLLNFKALNWKYPVRGERNGKPYVEYIDYELSFHSVASDGTMAYSSESKVITYDNTNLLDAFFQIAKEWECDCWIEGNVIHYGRLENKTEYIPLIRNGIEATEIDASDSKGDFATRIYAYGSDKNIPQVYRKELRMLCNAVIDKNGKCEISDSVNWSDQGKMKIDPTYFSDGVKSYNSTLYVPDSLLKDEVSPNIKSLKRGEVHTREFNPTGYTYKESNCRRFSVMGGIFYVRPMESWKTEVAFKINIIAKHQSDRTKDATLLSSTIKLPELGFSIMHIEDVPIDENLVWRCRWQGNGWHISLLNKNTWLYSVASLIRSGLSVNSVLEISVSADRDVWYVPSDIKIVSKVDLFDNVALGLCTEPNLKEKYHALTTTYNCFWNKDFNPATEGNVTHDLNRIKPSGSSSVWHNLPTISRHIAKMDLELWTWQVPTEENDCVVRLFTTWKDSDGKDIEREHEPYTVTLKSADFTPDYSMGLFKATIKSIEQEFIVDGDSSESGLRSVALSFKIDSKINARIVRAQKSNISVRSAQPTVNSSIKILSGELSGQEIPIMINEGGYSADSKAEEYYTIYTSKVQGARLKASLNKGESIYYEFTAIVGSRVPSWYFTEPLQPQVKLNSVGKRLMLPNIPIVWNEDEKEYKGHTYNGEGFVDSFDNLPESEVIETAVVFDDVFPSAKLIAHGVKINPGEYEYEDENTKETKKLPWNYYRLVINYAEEKDELLYDENGNPYYKHLVHDTGVRFPFSSEYEINGEDTYITFSSGLLNGMTFKIHFNPDGNPENYPEDQVQIWEIEVNEDYGRPLPDDTLKPSVADSFTIYGYDVTYMQREGEDSLVAIAERKLLKYAIQYIDKAKRKDLTYNITIAPEWAKGSLPYCVLDSYDNVKEITKDPLVNEEESRYPYLGDLIVLYNQTMISREDAYRTLRVIGYEYALDLPYDKPKYTLGETAAYSRIQDIENKSESLTSVKFEGNLGGGKGGSATYVIRKIDSTLPNDTNVFSALRTESQFLSKKNEDATPYKLTVGGLQVNGNTTMEGEVSITQKTRIKADVEFGAYGLEKGISGAGIFTDADGNMTIEVDNAIIHNKLSVQEVEIQELNYIGGSIIVTPAEGFVVQDLQLLDEERNVITNDSEPNYYKLYWAARNGNQDIANTWKENDQALSQTFNIRQTGTTSYDEVTDVSSYWWRLVVEAGSEEVFDESGSLSLMNYIIVSNTSKASNSTIPQVGEKVVMLGSQGAESTRKNAIMISAAQSGAPFIKVFNSIDNFTLNDDYAIAKISPEQVSFLADKFYIMNESLGSSDKGQTIKQLIEDINEQLGDDEGFQIWNGENENAPLPNEVYFSNSNFPAQDWKTDEERDNHIGDYFITSDGVSYKWQAKYIEGIKRYVWVEAEDHYLYSLREITNALQTQIDNFSDDGVITALEKKTLYTEWQRIQSEYTQLTTTASSLEIPVNDLANAYNSLSNYLRNVFLNMTEDWVLTNKNDLSSKTSAYYNASNDISARVVAKQQKSTLDIAENLKIYASDEFITSNEVRGITKDFNDLKSEFDDAVTQLSLVCAAEQTTYQNTQIGTDYIGEKEIYHKYVSLGLANAYNGYKGQLDALDKYLNDSITGLLHKEFPISIAPDAFLSKFQSVNAARNTFLKCLSDEQNYITRHQIELATEDGYFNMTELGMLETTWGEMKSAYITLHASIDSLFQNQSRLHINLSEDLLQRIASWESAYNGLVPVMESIMTQYHGALNEGKVSIKLAVPSDFNTKLSEYREKQTDIANAFGGAQQNFIKSSADGNEIISAYFEIDEKGHTSVKNNGLVTTDKYASLFAQEVKNNELVTQADVVVSVKDAVSTVTLTGDQLDLNGFVSVNDNLYIDQDANLYANKGVFGGFVLPQMKVVCKGNYHKYGYMRDKDTLVLDVRELGSCFCLFEGDIYSSSTNNEEVQRVSEFDPDYYGILPTNIVIDFPYWNINDEGKDYGDQSALSYLGISLTVLLDFVDREKKVTFRGADYYRDGFYSKPSFVWKTDQFKHKGMARFKCVSTLSDKVTNQLQHPKVYWMVDDNVIEYYKEILENSSKDQVLNSVIMNFEGISQRNLPTYKEDIYFWKDRYEVAGKDWYDFKKRWQRIVAKHHKIAKENEGNSDYKWTNLRDTYVLLKHIVEEIPFKAFLLGDNEETLQDFEYEYLFNRRYDLYFMELITEQGVNYGEQLSQAFINYFNALDAYSE